MKPKIDMEYIIKKVSEKNISLTEIANKTGYSRASVSRYFHRRRVPSIDFVNKVFELIE